MNGGALPFVGCESEGTACKLCTLFHARKAHAKMTFAAVGLLLPVKTQPVVVDSQLNVVFHLSHGQGHRVSLAMLGNIIEGLLGNPVYHDFQAIWNVLFSDV